MRQRRRRRRRQRDVRRRAGTCGDMCRRSAGAKLDDGIIIPIESSGRLGGSVGGHALGIGSGTAMDGSDRPQPLASILLLSHVGVLLPCLDA